MEFHKININDKEKQVKIDLSAEIDIRNSEESKIESEFVFQPEYGGWMIEVIPKHPFKFEELFKMERSIESLYQNIGERIGQDRILSMSSYPMLGVENYYIENVKKEIDEDFTLNLDENPFSKSQFFNDICISSHPRFGHLFI